MKLIDEYSLWNDIIADALFPELEIPALAFLDLEGDALDVIARERDLEPEEVIPELVAVVKQLLNSRTLTSTFSWFAMQTTRWSEIRAVDPPPALGLLALFATAAERMEAGDGISASNYYGQLSRLLEIDLDRVGEAYRKVSDQLWDSLVSWLNAFGGRRGLPVTFSVGNHRYIGRARAQALIRDVDRRRLQSFFQEFDLAPLSVMTPDQLRPLFNAWIETSRHASNQLAELWRRPEVKEHLLDAVAGTLSAWDGHLTDRDDTGVISSRIRLALNRVRLRRRVSLSFVLEVPKYEEGRNAALMSEDGEHLLELLPGRPGEMTVPGISQILSAESLLGSKITITDPHAGELTRIPRRMMVLRQDEMTGSWLEVSQVRMGDEVSILVRQDFEIEDVLADVSGTDWTIHTAESLPGVPVGWALIEGIVIVGRPQLELSEFDDRSVLIPITQVAFEFSGGLRVPTPLGAKPHFHHAAPPAITVSANGEPFIVRLFDLSLDEPELLEEPWRSTEGEPIVANLAGLELEPGRYGLQLTVQGELTEREFWLVGSGSDTDASWEYESVVHDSDDPLFAVNRMSETLEAGEFTVHGLPTYVVEGTEDPVETASRLTNAPWWRRVRENPAQPIDLPVIESSSCVWTGAHKERIEESIPDEFGYHRGVSVGVCEGCGRQKRYFNSYYRNRRRWLRRKEDGDNARPTRAHSRETALGTAVDWDLVLDLVITIGGGDAALLRRITQQFDPSARFYHELVMTLESLGHIEVLRDLHTGEVTTWETSPTSIVDVGPHRRLVGHWTREDRENLEAMGIRLNRKEVADAPSLVTTLASASEIETVSPGNLVVVDPAKTLAGSLPRLSEVVEELPVVPLPSLLQWEKYAPVNDAWLSVAQVLEPGAYRTVGYSRRYFLVSGDDLATQSGRRVNVPLAKHGAALIDIKLPVLMAYAEADRELIVPLGAPLPGMYGRAATLASGLPPRRRDLPGIGSYVVYQEVDRDLAHRLAALIGA